MTDHRETETRAAVRWSMNMLVEVLGNHGRHIHDKDRDCLRSAIRELAKYREHAMGLEEDTKKELGE